MLEQDMTGQVNMTTEALPLPEDPMVRYLGMAGDVLTGIPVFDRMEAVAQEELRLKAAKIAQKIEGDHKGRWASASPDADWETAMQVHHSPKRMRESIFGGLKLALGGLMAESVYRTLFSMLAEGVTTKTALAEKRRASGDELTVHNGGLGSVSREVAHDAYSKFGI